MSCLLSFIAASMIQRFHSGHLELTLGNLGFISRCLKQRCIPEATHRKSMQSCAQADSHRFL